MSLDEKNIVSNYYNLLIWKNNSIDKVLGMQACGGNFRCRKPVHMSRMDGVCLRQMLGWWRQETP